MALNNQTVFLFLLLWIDPNQAWLSASRSKMQRDEIYLVQIPFSIIEILEGILFLDLNKIN